VYFKHALAILQLKIAETYYSKEVPFKDWRIKHVHTQISYSEINRKYGQRFL